MPRALLSVSDKTGLAALASRAGPPPIRARLDRRNGEGADRRGLGGHQRLRRDRLPRDDGRPGQDPPPPGPWRHPRQTQPRRGPRGRARTRHRTGRPRRRQPVSVRQDGRPIGRELRRSDRADRHRRSQPGAGRGQEFPRRPCRGGSARTTRQCWTALATPGGPSPAFRFDLARKAFAHTAAYDAAIASTLGTVQTSDAEFVRPALGDAVAAASAGARPAKAARSSLRRESASEGGMVRAHT